MALVNETFLQLVKKETHRGLEGRALQRFTTAGSATGTPRFSDLRPVAPRRRASRSHSNQVRVAGRCCFGTRGLRLVPIENLEDS
jgi:hypothetical protein